MAHIVISTTKEERNKVLEALRTIGDRVTAVSEIAKVAGLKASRVRYAIQDLVDAGTIERVPHKAFNKHYIRYSYKVLKGGEAHG